METTRQEDTVYVTPTGTGIITRGWMTAATESTVIAALALAAQQYDDPNPVYAALRELRPDVDWSEWIADVEYKRHV